MPTPTQLATAAAAALDAATDVDAALRALLDTVGAIDVARVYDVGSSGAALVVLPGWAPLAEPTEYVRLAVMV